MEVFRNDSSIFCYGILNGRKYKLFGMVVAHSISDNLFGIIIKYGCKIEVNTFIDDMCKITSPYNIWCQRTESSKIVHDSWSKGWSTNDLSMHILLLLISWLDEVFSFPLFRSNAKFLHESSCLLHAESKFPTNTSVTIPGMLFMNRNQYVFYTLISDFKLRKIEHAWSGNVK